MRDGLHGAVVWRRGGICCGGMHIDRHGFYHTGIDLIEPLYLLSHFATLVIYLIYRTNLLTGSLELHLVNLADARERTVEIFHLLAVTREAGTLLINFFKRTHKFFSIPPRNWLEPR